MSYSIQGNKILKDNVMVLTLTGEDEIVNLSVRLILDHLKKEETKVMMKVVCAWCQKLMRDNPEASVISHGICGSCYNKINPESL